MPTQKDNRTPQACIHLYNPPVPPAGYLSRPRSIAHTPKMRNKPNLPQQPPSPTPKMQNKPNLSPHRHPGDRPTTQKCETNPIPAYQVSHRPLFMRNKPNLPQQPPSPTPKNAKRTQFPPAAGSPALPRRFDRLGGGLFNLPVSRQRSGIQHYRTWESI